MSLRRRSFSLYIDGVENYQPSMTKLENAFSLLEIPFPTTEILEKLSLSTPKSKIPPLDCQQVENDELLLIMEYLNSYMLEQGMARIFREFDKDGDGFISPEELRQLLINLGEDFCQSDIIDMIAVADKDGDGRVNQCDFTNLLTSIQSQSTETSGKSHNSSTLLVQTPSNISLESNFSNEESCNPNTSPCPLTPAEKPTVLPKNDAFTKKSFRHQWKKALKSLRK